MVQNYQKTSEFGLYLYVYVGCHQVISSNNESAPEIAEADSLL